MTWPKAAAARVLAIANSGAAALAQAIDRLALFLLAMTNSETMD